MTRAAPSFRDLCALLAGLWVVWVATRGSAREPDAAPSRTDSTSPSAVTFTWRAPPGCPRAAFAARIAESPRAPGVDVSVEIDIVEGGAFSGTLRVGPEVRTLRQGACEELSKALGLAAAMLLDAAAAAAPQPQASDAAADNAATDGGRAADGGRAITTPDASEAPSARAREVSSPSSTGTEVDVRAGLALSVLEATPVPEGVLGLALQFTAPFAFVFDLAFRTTRVRADAFELPLSWVIARPALCLSKAWLDGHLPTQFCGVVEAGTQLVGTVEGPADGAPQTRPWFGAGPRVAIGYTAAKARVFRWGLALELSLLGLVTRPQYALEDGPVLLRTAPLWPAASVIFGLRIP
jgi:hypothetical protein